MNGPRIYRTLTPEERRLRFQEHQLKRQKKAHRRRRRWICALFAILFVFLGVQIERKLVQRRQINQQVQASKQTLVRMKQKDRRLTLKRTDLKDPNYVAKLVRSKFYYSKPGEKIYHLASGDN